MISSPQFGGAGIPTRAYPVIKRVKIPVLHFIDRYPKSRAKHHEVRTQAIEERLNVNLPLDWQIPIEKFEEAKLPGVQLWTQAVKVCYRGRYYAPIPVGSRHTSPKGRIPRDGVV